MELFPRPSYRRNFFAEDEKDSHWGGNPVRSCNFTRPLFLGSFSPEVVTRQSRRRKLKKLEIRKKSDGIVQSKENR